MRLKHFRLDTGAQILLACSDRSRLRILNLILVRGEMCITDIERVLDFTQSKTSRHLLYLRNSGILNIRKINQWSFYTVKDEVLDVIRVLLQFVEGDPELQQDLRTCQILQSNRELPGSDMLARLTNRRNA